MKRILSKLLLGTFLTGTGVAYASPTEAPAGTPVEGEPAAPSEAHGAGEEAHEGTEAAHGEGDHGGGHHEVSYTADDDHDGTANWRDADSTGYALGGVGQHAYNFLIFAALVGFWLRQPLSDALKNRAVGIRKEITDTARARDEARQRYEELSARLSAFEDEVRRLRADAEADADAEQRKLIERANNEAKRLTLNSERNIRDELVRARIALQEDAVALAVKLAEQTLKNQVQSEDQRRLARQFLESLNQQEVGHG